jgi:hypothetical protein
MCKWGTDANKLVHGCCKPITDGKKKHLTPKIKISSCEPLINVKNTSSFYVSIYMLYCLLELILVEPVFFFFARAFLQINPCIHNG